MKTHIEIPDVLDLAGRSVILFWVGFFGAMSLSMKFPLIVLILVIIWGVISKRIWWASIMDIAFVVAGWTPAMLWLVNYDPWKTIFASAITVTIVVLSEVIRYVARKEV